MRAFIAIELPKEVKEVLRDVQERLKASGADVKWVEPKNIHLTLKFLGEISDEQLHKITAILNDISKDKKSFLIRLSSLGAFPKINSPRVIWIGIDRGQQETKALAQALEEKIEKIGIPQEDRPFSSHITIGRTRSNLGRDKLVAQLNNLADYFKKMPQELTVDKITLFKSTLAPQGPIYEVLKEVSLITA
jgi:2'-5' RNA ligase